MKKCFAAILASFLLISTGAQAMIVYGVSNDEAKLVYDGTENAAQHSVVNVASASAVYLGNGWFLTANHVGVTKGANIVQNGTSAGVSYVYSSFSAENGNVDIKLFYSEDVAKLKSLEAVSVSQSICDSIRGAGKIGSFPVSGSEILFVTGGKGRADDTDLTAKTVSASSSTYAIRSQLNDVDAVLSAADYGYNYFLTLSTAEVGEVAITYGDSGGGMFYESDGKFYLVGTPVGITNPGGNVDTVVFGTNSSDSSYAFSLNLSTYADSINAIISTNPLIPEPSACAAIFGVLIFCAVIYRGRSS